MWATKSSQHFRLIVPICNISIRSMCERISWINRAVIDAFGKPPSGILSGNNLWIGSWSACRRISVLKNRQGQRWSGQYCMAMFQPFNRDNPLKAMDTQTKYDPTAHCRATSILPNKTEANDDDDKCFTLIPLLNYGFCTPDTCTNYDVKKIVEFVYKGAEVAADRNFVCNVDINCRNDRPENHLSYSRASMTVLFFIIFVVVLMIFGTLYDYIVYQKELFELDEATCYKKQNWFVKTIIAFSVYTNGKVILRTEKGENQIHCLHGIRVLSMFWIILGHTYYYICTNLTTDNLLPTMVAFPKRFFNLIIVQAPLAVDTFFYLR
ncbi:hypothetical protein AB6A40_007742 [Gnathostoma spinigerum]|uniref:Nose resistant-to-fluoxetine protein N-terminal domain-containing protein n=1 Tax=Gnathostoma spinigerum TaxID=75299 RepID=A0ABD6EMC6_9BILA